MAGHSVDELTVVSSLAPDTDRSCDRTEVVLILIQANQDLEALIGTDQIERAREVTSEDVLERSLIELFGLLDLGSNLF